MDLLLAESLRLLKDEGLQEASLANAPLANVGAPRGPLDRGVALLFENLNGFYGTLPPLSPRLGAAADRRGHGPSPWFKKLLAAPAQGLAACHPKR